MAVFNKKSRMISFRLTADEYTEAINRCQKQGHRSVSALARTATLGDDLGPIHKHDKLLELREHVSLLRTDIDRIALSLLSAGCSPADGLPVQAR